MLTFVHTTYTAAQSIIKNQEEKVPEYELEEIMVSATKAELSLLQTSRIVNIITQQDIEKQPVQSVEEILKYIAGIDVRQRGAHGIQSDISLRGGTFDQTAILLNGANLSNPQSGHYSFDIPINLSDIERIEIIQGPSSLLFGASAFSGGINIITKKKSGYKGYMEVSAGMHESYNLEGNTNFNIQQSSHRLSAGYKSSEGYIQNSDYKIFNTLLQSNYQLDNTQLDLQIGYNCKNYGANTFYSAAYPNQYDETESIYTSLRAVSTSRIKSIYQFYWNRHFDSFHLIRPGWQDFPETYDGPNNHRSDVYGFNLNSQYKWLLGLTNFGGEVRTEGIVSSVLGKKMEKPSGKYIYSDNRSNISYFLEHTCFSNYINITFGILSNYNTGLNESFSFYPNINIALKPNKYLNVYFAFNSAVRMPTFTDLYYTTETHIGNSDLSPEKTQSFELGIKYKNDISYGYVNGFLTKGKNMLDWVKENPEDLWESRNHTRLNKIGMEVYFSFDIQKIMPVFNPGTKFSLNYMYIDQIKNSGGLISNYALDYLKHKLTANVILPVLKDISAGCYFRWQARQGSYIQYENYKPAIEVPYSAYGIMDLKISWQIKQTAIYISANNIFDKMYYDLGNIPQPGLWINGGINYTIK